MRGLFTLAGVVRFVPPQLYFRRHQTTVASIVWSTRDTDNRVKACLSPDHEYIVVYGRRANGSIPGRVIDRSDFKNPDNNPRGPYVTDPLTGKATTTTSRGMCSSMRRESVVPEREGCEGASPVVGCVRGARGLPVVQWDSRGQKTERWERVDKRGTGSVTEARRFQSRLRGSVPTG